MKNNKTKINFFKVAIILSMILGLNGCNTQHDRAPRIRVQDFVKKDVEDGNLSFRNKAAGVDMEFIKCGPRYDTKCPSTRTGFKPIGSQLLNVLVTAFQKPTGSVDCFILIQIPDYPPIRVTWHEEGDSCSAGQQS